jgi:hypothetical protein
MLNIGSEQKVIARVVSPRPDHRGDLVGFCPRIRLMYEFSFCTVHAERSQAKDEGIFGGGAVQLSHFAAAMLEPWS